ncbi:hypothetical protein DICSQDRAFT_181700 [Dichomitus squalens LYAD-421 SS1]|uniref:Uncharacterized protein n=1 Tax=Dichomitus squalens (strain LYAD-421) TaxID=732165 RepID=R7SV46_DICSQ|nr:uncharacterized protein DICSQDRAFT_181700 [Dichomitus squalens LYAD-421 SS1]EJF59941.1 hypothetical protein DICSQDRAFT_181700 [Dichomitus squalens LYAD-421 SS1]
MEDIPRPFSPEYVPQPLNPSPFHTRFTNPQRVPTPAVLPERSGSHLYLSTVSQPVQEPIHIIHDFYNVSPIAFHFAPNGSLPRTVELPLISEAETRPTHALAILSSTIPSSSNKPYTSLRLDTFPSAPPSASLLDRPRDHQPYLIPIDASTFFLNFGHDVARSLGALLTSRPAKSQSPPIRRDRENGTRFVTLPVIPLHVPHPPSLPHVLLFGQGIPLPKTPSPPAQSDPPSSPRSASDSGRIASPSMLATYLLPVSAIEEFPSSPAMAAIMARQCSSEELATRVAFNHGIWRNTLLLAPTDAALEDLVRIAWNVTIEAQRLQRQGDAASARSLSPSLAPSLTPAARRPTPVVVTSTTDHGPTKDADRDGGRNSVTSPRPSAFPTINKPASTAHGAGENAKAIPELIVPELMQNVSSEAEEERPRVAKRTSLPRTVPVAAVSYSVHNPAARPPVDGSYIAVSSPTCGARSSHAATPKTAARLPVVEVDYPVAFDTPLSKARCAFAHHLSGGDNALMAPLSALKSSSGRRGDRS